MRYENPDLQDRLASEYVLGTLQGAARRRFQRVLLQHPGLRDAVSRWERRLAPLGSLASADAPPPPAVWAAIRAETLAASPPRIARFRNRRPWLVAALAAGLVLAFSVDRLANPSRAPATQPFAELRATPGQSAWTVVRDPVGQRLLIRVNGDLPAKQTAEDWELWALLPQQGVRSLGLVRFEGHRAVMTLDVAQWQALDQATGVGVSREPAGGSPQDTPTGPVVYTGRVSG